MKILDSITCEILNDVSLIEASAGTGKTYNIQNIFVRMIMESGFSIESILVVTFTDAATNELKSRIRSILSELNDFFDNPNNSNNERIKALAENGGIDKNIKHSRIIKAARDFDKASISTIHSFCKQILDENVFSTSSFFQQELQKNSEKIIEKITQNFYRKHFYTIDAKELALFQYNKISIQGLIKYISSLKNTTNFEFSQSYKVNESVKLLEEFQNKIRNHFSRNQITEILNKKIMSQTSYKSEIIEEIFNALDNFLDNKFTADDLKLIGKFSPDKIKSGTKKNKTTPTHKLFEIVEDLFEKLDDIIIDYKNHIYYKFYYYFINELKNEKQKSAFRTFDDLITQLDENLDTNLVNKIKDEYNAVLIDEFQDTDAIQYSIFSKIFIMNNKPTFLIGDPKQAIYSFRGGDIFTYKTAKEDVQNKNGRYFTLPMNYRSTNNMVNAVNELFLSLPPGKEFFNDFIKFNAVKSQKNQKEKIILASDEISKSLDIFYNSTITNENDGNEFAIDLTVNKILDLITNPEYLISEHDLERRILPSDIAILVTTHNQAAALLPVLQDANIPAVVQQTGSVFDCDEAVSIELLLRAIEEPANLNGIRGALTSFLFDVSSEDLYKMSMDESAEELDDWILFFRDCQKLWQNRGFIETFNFIMSTKKLKPHILSQKNGERKLTNLFHLQELIQKKEIDSSLGMTGIINWFKQQLDSETRDKDDDKELRLDTDESSLKIMTIFKSKGLEFPIVFCPFLWTKDSKVRDDVYIQYHDDNNKKIIDFDKAKINLTISENLQENIRIAYVALTRAKYKAFLIDIQNKKLSVMKYFLYNISNKNCDEVLKEIFKEIKNKEITKFKDFIETGNINFAVEQSFTKPDRKYSQIVKNPKKPEENLFTGKLEKEWDINSFSSLSKKNIFNKLELEKTDDKDIKIEDEYETSEFNIFTFPASAKTGSCWHSIFEEISFKYDEKEVEEKASEKLSSYGIFPENSDQETKNSYITITTEMVKNVLNSKIFQNDNYSLQHLKEKEKITEMEFFLSIQKDIQPEEINKLLKNYNLKSIENIPSGFLGGFIDLVFKKDEKFYILDWKSNSLGQNINDYSLDKINVAMHEHQYNLQYIIYTVALHKYLKKRIPNYNYDQHFGGVFYIFLRGVYKDNPKNGVFFHKPPKELIANLSTLMS